ncbi:MAG TPA: NifU N-terminal domain-containing protein [Gemmatimonadota bacterium]|nr:NifU N-terminal domain-containing protein [Gemmatimonadota bacterium]
MILVLVREVARMGDTQIRIQQTPNPNSLLFHVDRTVTEKRMQQFNSTAETADAPLARALFEIANVTSIFFMPNSITVSKKPEGDWDTIAAEAEQTIRSHFEE